MKKFAQLFVNLLLAAFCALCFSCCAPEKTDGTCVASVEKEDGFVAITVTELEGEAALSDVMEQLRADGEISFVFDATGMLTELEGVQNAADWSACWMLYLNDAELADQSYTKEWRGFVYGSAPVGATQLPVTEGCTYLWSYDTF